MSWFDTLSKGLKETVSSIDLTAITEEIQQAGQKALHLAEDAFETVKATVENQVKELEKEREHFVEEKHAKAEFDMEEFPDALPVWMDGNEDERDELRDKVLQLSTDKRTFLVDPPAGTDFQFDMMMLPTAMATLRADPELQKMRFELVPGKLKESVFWSNYFYRVSLIKASMNQQVVGHVVPSSPIVTQGPTEASTETKETTNLEVATEPNVDDWEKELEALKDVVKDVNQEELESWEKDLDDILGA